MKKLLFTLTLTGALLGSTAITRAEDPKPEAPAARGPGARLNPEERLKRMTETLGLTQDQQDKIKAIFEKNKSKADEIRSLPEDQRRDKFREFMKSQQEDIAAVLTQEQKDKMRAEAEKRRAERGAGGGAPKADAAK